jgi:hypothetical protein
MVDLAGAAGVAKTLQATPRAPQTSNPFAGPFEDPGQGGLELKVW